jgi:hypothetical protein
MDMVCPLKKSNGIKRSGLLSNNNENPSTMTLAFGGVMTVISVGNLDDGPRLWRCVWFAFGSWVAVRCSHDGRVS